MISEDVWYRLWSREEDDSKIVEKEVIDDLLDRGKIDYATLENFYDPTFGSVLVLHYVYRARES